MAMVIVVLMHWTVQRVSWGADGFRVENALHGTVAVAATWLLQVMPLFFLAGGVVNTITYDRAARNGESDAAFVGVRARRLLTATLPVLLVVAPLTTLGWLLGQGGPARQIADNTANPWWFLVAYLVCVASTPLAVRSHDRHGWWPLLLALAAAVTANDGARRLLPTAPGLGDLNVVLVWLTCHQLGVVYARGSLARVPRFGLWAITAAAVLGIVGLIGQAGYPDVTIGLADHPNQNLMPPTLALVLLAVAQVCLMALVAPAVGRWQPKRRTETFLTWANLLLFPVFLWHLPAFFVFLGLGTAVDWLLPADEATFWALRPLVLLITTAFLSLIIAVVVPGERIWLRYGAAASPTRVTAGVLCGIVGTYLVWQRGIAPFDVNLVLDPVAICAMTLVATAVALLTVRRPIRLDE